MKKSIVICIVFIALFAIVSCENAVRTQPAEPTEDSDFSGNDSDTNNPADTGDTSPTDTGSDSGDTVADTGDTVPDTGDTGADTGDTGTDTGDTASGTATCLDIYYCSKDCTDQACLDACIASGTPEAQETLNAMYTCWETYCADTAEQEEFSDCVMANCANETEACSSHHDHDNPDYPAPYGTLQINLAANYLMTDETQFQQNMVNMSSFATGMLGSSDIIPEENQISYYYAALIQEGGQQYIQIIQNYTTDQGQKQLNPVIFIILPANAALGTVRFGLDTESIAQMFIADFDGGQVSCYHGFGYGELFITSLNPAAGDAGDISMNGTIEIYSALNSPMYGGNITSQLSGWVNCEPR